MNVVSYSDFGKLRLKMWFPENQFLEDQDSWCKLINEGVRGVNFFRSMEFPEETFEVQLDMFDVAGEVQNEILAQIGLLIKPGNTTAEVIGLLGEPLAVKRFRRRQTTFHEFKVGCPESYHVTCTYDDDKGLTNVKVKRDDIPYPKSGDEPDDSTEHHLHLDEYEVLPENVLSPESPVSKVRLMLQSFGNFRYLIHVRNQNGMQVEAARLNIRNAATKHPATVINLRLTVPTQAVQVIELEGLIDKELLFLAFVELSLRDEVHNTSQSVFIEFDQWYGKLIG